MDAAYKAMMRAIHEKRTPNLFVLHYDLPSWTVRNLMLIPHFVFSASAIEKRKPLAASARRAGWVGCNIVLKNIPADAKISLVENSSVVLPQKVRERFRQLNRALEGFSVLERGWTLDVLRIVRSLGKKQFTNDDVYNFAPQLQQLHPDNRNVIPKIRQQLQVLRDRDFLTHVKKGVWAVRQTSH